MTVYGILESQGTEVTAGPEYDRKDLMIMSDILTKFSFISEADENYIDFSDAVVVTSAKQTGAVTVVVTDNSKRLVLGSEILQKLESPEAVLVRVKGNRVGITPVPSDAPGAQAVRKGGVIYNTNAAQQVANALGVELPEKGSTRMGKCTYQQSADGNVTAVVS